MIKFYMKWIFIHCAWKFLKKEYTILSLFYLGIFPIICLLYDKKFEQYTTSGMIFSVTIVGLCVFIINYESKRCDFHCNSIRSKYRHRSNNNHPD